jgi:hypothetical protein
MQSKILKIQEIFGNLDKLYIEEKIKDSPSLEIAIDKIFNEKQEKLDLILKLNNEFFIVKNEYFQEISKLKLHKNLMAINEKLMVPINYFI